MAKKQDTTKTKKSLDQLLKECTEANSDSLWKCNPILEKYPQKAPVDTSKVKTYVGVRGPNYGKKKKKK